MARNSTTTVAKASMGVIRRLEKENRQMRATLWLAKQDLSLLVAKHAIGRDKTAIRMTKYLHNANQ